jgi:hypothetical protein
VSRGSGRGRDYHLIGRAICPKTQEQDNSCVNHTSKVPLSRRLPYWSLKAANVTWSGRGESRLSERKSSTNIDRRRNIDPIPDRRAIIDNVPEAVHFSRSAHAEPKSNVRPHTARKAFDLMEREAMERTQDPTYPPDQTCTM